MPVKFFVPDMEDEGGVAVKVLRGKTTTLLAGESRAASKHFMASGMKERNSCFHIFGKERRSRETHSTRNQPPTFYIQGKRRTPIGDGRPFSKNNYTTCDGEKKKCQVCTLKYDSRGSEVADRPTYQSK